MRRVVLVTLLLSACVPRARYRAAVSELEATRELVLLQQVAMAQLEAEVERLGAGQRPARPAGPPPVQASTYRPLELQEPALMGLSMPDQERAMAVLNSEAGACAPCKERGLSAAACLMEQPGCKNMPGLVRRVAGLAAGGAGDAVLRDALAYEQPWQPGVSTDGHARGPADAPVTIVMFMEPQCPYCVRGSATMQQLEERYGPRLRLVYKHMPLPFHQRARPAAIAMEAAAQQGRFWEFHDALYARAGELNESGALLSEIASQLGLDLGRFEEDCEDPALAARVDADVELAGSLGVTGTPNFFVNGYPMRGAQPVDKFAALIDRELEGARR